MLFNLLTEYQSYKSIYVTFQYISHFFPRQDGPELRTFMLFDEQMSRWHSADSRKRTVGWKNPWKTRWFFEFKQQVAGVKFYRPDP